jgi:hypothetical protein
MQDKSQSFAFFETPESLVLFERPATKSASRLAKRLKAAFAGVFIAGFAIAVFSADSPVESETTRWQRVSEAAENCSNLDPGSAAHIHCRVEAANTP